MDISLQNLYVDIGASRAKCDLTIYFAVWLSQCVESVSLSSTSSMVKGVD